MITYISQAKSHGASDIALVAPPRTKGSLPGILLLSALGRGVMYTQSRRKTMEQRGVLKCVETSGKHTEQGRDMSREGVGRGRSEESCPPGSADANLLQLRSASRRKLR